MKRLSVICLLTCSLAALAKPTSEATNKNHASANATTAAQQLMRTGSGVRKKTVFLIPISVYRATLFVSDIARFSRHTEGIVALKSMTASPPMSAELVLDFERSVSAADILSSFETALKANGVKDSKSIMEFKAAVKNAGDVKSGQRVIIRAVNGNIVCEFGDKKVEIKGDSHTFAEVFSIWLGVPADDGLKALKDALILGK